LEVERREDPLVEADPPAFGCIFAVLAELGVEVRLLMQLLTGELLGYQHGNALHHHVLAVAASAVKAIRGGFQGRLAAGADDLGRGSDATEPSE
jgi:hypothetical protein